MRAQVSPPTDAAPRPGLRLTYEQVLALLLAAEVAVFSFIGTNFLSGGNAFELVRLAVEVGLLALALAPVIVTGGIDLSVGSLMGLSAVLFGMLSRDGLAISLGGQDTLRILPPLPLPVAAVAALAISTLAGG